MESQLGDKRELQAKLPCDPSNAVESGLLDELRAGNCYAACETPDYLAYVWFEAEEFKAEVWLSGQPQELLAAASVDELRENLEFFYGGQEA